jgi:hypothetical protein
VQIRVFWWPGSDSALAGVWGLGLELGAEPVGSADGAADAPLGALGTAGGPAEREQTLRGALLRGIGELLAAPVIGELLDGELVHGDLSLVAVVGLSCALLSLAARVVTIRSGAQKKAQEGHRIRLGGEMMPADLRGAGRHRGGEPAGGQ